MTGHHPAPFDDHATTVDDHAARFHLAQLNLAKLKYPLDDPRVADFVAWLKPINEMAERWPGFVWRLVDESGEDATSIQPLGPETIVNMTVWESQDALWDYTYRSGHLDALRRRGEWFERPTRPMQVLWWIPAGHIPTVDEALERLELLRAEGPSPRAFTFREAFTPADVEVPAA
ncbi:DUF3291 domain-containing protein [Actinomadura rudentiformis]|uniref:DUF3291 domain-containing protein n=1 Tax=Actinomadura rudentiformis TaxID=359158 RepID=A0A6H9YQW7_9ACTN|nr:DUF3291 domain-containing protein [Actinomadura rudentiformis]KAB2348958.1 DUF3291 domain-containing protein [Actinomadura rudentiformis]